MYQDVLAETRESELDTVSRDSHIYKREIVARNYDRSFIREFHQIQFEKFIPEILDEHTRGWNQLKVFEGGVGTGQFTIPIIRYVLQRGSNSFLMGNDNSKAMLKMFFNKPEFCSLQNQGNGRISIKPGDLEKREDYPTDINFNVLVFTGVLHCLPHQHFFLKQLNRLLEINGILILTFKTDFFTRLQCGELFSDPSIDPHYGNFWRYYCHLRDSYNTPLDHRCQFIYNVSLVNKLIQIQFNNRYVQRKIHEFFWDSKATFEKMAQSIENGLTFATGQGVPLELLPKLGEEMREWISMNGLEQKEVPMDHKMELVVWEKTA